MASGKKDSRVPPVRRKTLYYACSKRGNVIGFKGLSKRVTELSSLSEGVNLRYSYLKSSFWIVETLVLDSLNSCF